MVDAKAGNYTLVVVEEIGLWNAQIEGRCVVFFQHYHVMLPHCHLGVVISQTASLLDPNWLSLAKIHSLTSYVSIGLVVI